MTHADLDHELPALRVHCAWEVAEAVGARHGVSRQVTNEIVDAVIAAIGSGTKRVGYACPICLGPVEPNGAGLAGFSAFRCPEHGSSTTVALTLAFPPFTDDWRKQVLSVGEASNG
jgi:hypothetical protein